MQSNIIFKDITRRRVWGGVERMGRRQGKSMEEKKKIWNEVWSGFNLCQLANKSMKAVLGMDIPSVT